MNALDQIKSNAKDGIRFPYPATESDLSKLTTPKGIRRGKFIFDIDGLWEQGERLYLTVCRKAGIIWMQLETLKEINL